jgi:putative intracellular protease/amidase
LLLGPWDLPRPCRAIRGRVRLNHPLHDSVSCQPYKFITTAVMAERVLRRHSRVMSSRAFGFRLGILVYPGVEVLDFAAPYGVFSVAQRMAPDLAVCLLGSSQRPVMAQAGLTVLPDAALCDEPALDALLIPGGPGMRQLMHDQRLHRYIAALPSTCLLATVSTGSWLLARMGWLGGVSATSRKSSDRLEATHLGKAPIDRLSDLAPTCRISHARLVDAGRILTAGGATAGLELGLHLLRRAGLADAVVDEVVQVLEYQRGHAIYAPDIEWAAPFAPPPRELDSAAAAPAEAQPPGDAWSAAPRPQRSRPRGVAAGLPSHP